MTSKQASKVKTFKMIIRQIGSLLIILGSCMVLPLLVSIIYAEFFSAAGFLISGLICFSIGLFFYRRIDVSAEPLNRHALVIAAVGWLSIAVMGALPYIIIACITPFEVAQKFVPAFAEYHSSIFYFKNPLHAIFESMSGFTTTGLSMAVHVPTLGRGLIFYRSFTQLLGGAGFIVLALALLGQSSGKIAYVLYGAESTGERLRPTIIQTARSIWKIYLGITLINFIYLVAGTYLILPDYNITDIIFDSINHAMAGQSTGGFSTLESSIASYNSKGMVILHLLPMLLGALSLPFYFKVLHEKRLSLFWKDLQTRSIFILAAIGSTILSFMLLKSDLISYPFLNGVFQFISALTTTGWQTSDIHAWNSSSVLFIVLAGMIVGGAAGATVGGVKIIRVLLLFKGLLWHINGYFYSGNSINVATFNDKRMLPDEMNRELAKVATFVFIYLVILLLGTLITFYTMNSGFTLKDALFESASAQGTVGLSCGITNPCMSPILEFTYIIQMWAGRLEIMPILILFRSVFIGTKPFVA